MKSPAGIPVVQRNTLCGKEPDLEGLFPDFSIVTGTALIPGVIH
ncbi:MAG: hypothetical protein WBC04_00125 [Candidatus Acidiferrales bacterium]